eukprot:UN4562
MRASYRFVLVEPNELFFPGIRANVQKLPLDLSRQVQLVHGMVTDSCEEAFKTMYRFSRRAEADFGVPWLVYGSWTSFIPEFPLVVLATSIKQGAWYLKAGSREQAWRRFYHAPNLTDYVEHFEVPCYSPATLAGKIGSLPSDLAMVVIDAEQADGRIVRKMMQTPGFKPAYLQWEGTPPDSPDVVDGAKVVQGHGFKVGRVFSTAAKNDCDNLVAFPVN